MAIYADENVSKVTVYLQEPYVTKMIREEKITRTTFLSNIGGLIGIFQGISVISFIEIMYFMILRLCQIRKSKTQIESIQTINVQAMNN